MANQKNYEDGLFRYDEGVLHKMARKDYELPCRACGNIVVEASAQCPRCGTYAPGIYSECPTCGSKNYTWKPYGRNNSAMLGGMILGGPIGAVIGAALGSGDAECVCLNCGQGWMPFSMVSGWLSTTRKFKLKKVPQQKKQVHSTATRQTNVSRQPQQSRVQQKPAQTHTSHEKEEGKKGIGSTILGICFLILCLSLVANGIKDAKEKKEQEKLRLEQERLLEERKEEQLHNNELSVDDDTDINEMEYLLAIQTSKNINLVVDDEMQNDLGEEFLTISCPTDYGVDIYYFEDAYPQLQNCEYIAILNLEKDGERIVSLRSNILSGREMAELMPSLDSVYKSDEIDAKKVLGYFTSTLDLLYDKYEKNETLAEACNIYLEDWYEMLSKNYSTQSIENKYKVRMLSVDNESLECYGYFGEYHGWLHYNASVSIYGLAGQYTNFSWTSDFGTLCSDEYIQGLYNLQYVDSGYHNNAKVTLYNWENKLLVSVVQSETNNSLEHTLIQAILYDEKITIDYW